MTNYPESCRRMTVTRAKNGQTFTVQDIHFYLDGWTAILDTEIEALRMAVAYQGTGRTSVAPGNDGRWLSRLTIEGSDRREAHKSALAKGVFR